jgi:predicted small metal-binding protein
VTLQGREQLYQQLLQRVTGQSDRPQGAYTCHFQNCNEVFAAATPNMERGHHFLNHLDNDHNEEQLCLFPECGIDLTGRSDSELVTHFAEHGQHICFWPRCGVNLFALSSNDRLRHVGEHYRKRCPLPSCNYLFSNPNSEDERVRHLIIHTRNRCQFPGCGHIFTDGNSEQEQRQHLLTHTRANCQFPGCGHIFTDGNLEDEHRQHWSTHTANGAPVQNLQPKQPPETPDTIPPRVRDQYRGVKLYCPHCLYAVTGKAQSMCRVSTTIIQNLRD